MYEQVLEIRFDPSIFNRNKQQIIHITNTKQQHMTSQAHSENHKYYSTKLILAVCVMKHNP